MLPEIYLDDWFKQGTTVFKKRRLHSSGGAQSFKTCPFLNLIFSPLYNLYFELSIHYTKGIQKHLNYEYWKQLTKNICLSCILNSLYFPKGMFFKFPFSCTNLSHFSSAMQKTYWARLQNTNLTFFCVRARFPPSTFQDPRISWIDVLHARIINLC